MPLPTKRSVTHSRWVEDELVKTTRGYKSKTRTIKKVQFSPAKRPGPTASVENEPANFYPIPEQLEQASQRSQNDLLREYKSLHRDELLRENVQMEAPVSDDMQCSCGEKVLWRCTDCLGSPEYCTRCCQAAHARLPFHQVERWNVSGFYTKSSLRLAGVVVHCGHSGQDCPSWHYQQSHCDGDQLNVPSKPDKTLDEQGEEDLLPEEIQDQTEELVDEIKLVRSFFDRPSDMNELGDHVLTIVDTSGIHFVAIRYCCCPEAKPCYLQLYNMGLFPASFRRVKSAFTFQVLDDFLLNNRICKTAASTYYSLLRRRTNSTFPQAVPDRYRELMRVVRQWRDMKHRKWHGFAHDTDKSPRNGDLAVFCPACPQAGINLPDDWENNPETWKYRRQQIMDGNFTMQHQFMKHPEDDVPLADGLGFFVEDRPYKSYLSIAKDSPPVKICNEHGATIAAGATHGKAEATGGGSTACVRHGAFQPHTTVDFQKGERQMNMDYSFAQACARIHPKQLKLGVVEFYDIMCQWSIYLQKRIEASPYLLQCFPDGQPPDIVKAIGLFHVHGHQDSCVARFSPNNIPGVGQVDGEVIETLWSILNDVSRSTRGMTAAHRTEVLGDNMDDSNWMKLTRMVPRLKSKHKAALRHRSEAIKAFNEVDSTLDEANRKMWDAQDRSAQAKHIEDPSAFDIYDVQMSRAPGKASRQLELAMEEGKSTSPARGTAQWISEGISIQETQLTLAAEARGLRVHPDVNDSLQHMNRCNRLLSTISKHEAQADEILCASQSPEPAGPHDNVGDGVKWDNLDSDHVFHFRETPDTINGDIPAYRVIIQLPSAFGGEERRQRGIEALTATELELRKGQAEDALFNLRVQLGYKSVLFRTKIRAAPGYEQRTRAWDETKAIGDKVRKYCRIYDLARSSMLALTDPTSQQGVEIRARYRPLEKSDLKVSTEYISNDIRGMRNTPQSWIWSMDAARDAQDSEWLREYQRVTWLKARHRRDRWVEEETLLRSEMLWTGLYYKHHRDCWMARAEAATAQGLSRGHTAYALRQAHIWNLFLHHARDVFIDVVDIPIQPHCDSDVEMDNL